MGGMLTFGGRPNLSCDKYQGSCLHESSRTKILLDVMHSCFLRGITIKVTSEEQPSHPCDRQEQWQKYLFLGSITCHIHDLCAKRLKDVPKSNVTQRVDVSSINNFSIGQ
ncbi:MAG: hypothetical protein QF448_08290, partial [Candidatus Thalassarchaeaceae archaeon]|nr:hypothetical protein [Candidatus Thalassarchaeaceae archaeon]